MQPRPKKRLGQNFLVDRNIQGKIIRSCFIKDDDVILEIGPGRGEITGGLLALAKEVIAVELDPQLCSILKEKFSSYPNLRLLNQDILKTDIIRLCPGKKIKVIANIPYYISSPVIIRLLEQRQGIEVIYLTLQKELALRLIAGPHTKEYGAFSCFVQFYSRPKILFAIKGSSFWPKPKVDSCFVELKVLSKPAVRVKDERLFFEIIRAAFSQRRKALKNSLAKIDCFSRLVGKDGLTGIDLKNSRAQDLSLSEFAALTG